MKTKLLLPACILLGLISACKKQKENPAAKTKTDLLTVQSWKRLAYTMTQNSGTPTDFFSLLPPYSKDNLYIFSVDKSFTNDEGATKNNAASPQTINTGSWDLFNGETKLSITISGNPYHYDIIQLDESKLQLKNTTISGGDTTVSDFTYIH